LGSLLVGISFAKATSFSLRLPLLGVNHLHSHIYSAFLRPQKRKISAKNAEFPFVALVASGGHTSLFYAKDFDEIKILGSTQDDACGEAFDKVAKILNLGYPGGPLIEKLAKKGNPHKIKFGCSDTNNPLDFSFSGIKTAVLYYVRRLASSPVSAAGGSAFGGSQLQMRQTGKSRMKQIYEGTLRDPEATLKKSLHSGQANRQTKNIAASFQQTVIDTLIRKSLLACRMKESKRLVLGGGVLANSRLREDFLREANRNNINLYLPPRELCTDNAAMVAGLGYQLFRRGHCSELDLSADPVAPLQK
jgi:N6-L-threonylcarbamoyladenine synthase